MIDSTTRLYGLLGNPVSGSRSPWIHNRVFDTSGMPGVYLAFRVEEPSLEAVLTGLKALDIGGVNITIPYKTDILPYLDSIDPEAAALGAVNTIVCGNGHWRGYNTDGPGLLAVLRRHLYGLENCRVLVLGAGGAARGICGSLIRGGIRDLGIWNRSLEKAQELALALQDTVTTAAKITVVESSDSFSGYDLIINATSVGMEPHIGETPVQIRDLKPEAVVCDIVYKPHRTRLIRDAEEAGHPVIHGIEMLIEQALLAQQLWNRLDEESVAVYRDALIKEFEELHK